MVAHFYDDNFMDYTARCALGSARIVVPTVTLILGRINSVCDFGCAGGAWLSIWRANGAEICGIDGDYVDRKGLMIPVMDFHPLDLARPIRLERRFDLVQCLEVAEHLPEGSARTLVSSLAAHSDRVLFSAAPPGQGGLGHLNEQPYQYWRMLFSDLGFSMFDCVRPKIATHRQVMPWYRYNTFVFAHNMARESLSSEVLATEISPGDRIPDIAPMAWQLRRTAVRLLPKRAQTTMARLGGAMLFPKKS